MKKTISILLSVCLLVAILPVSSYASYSADEIKLNFDYNADKKIDLNDARTVLRVSANLEEPKEGLIYDVTGNGDGITMEDVKKIVAIVTGIDTEVNECAEFNLELFKAELNSVKSVKPGFTKTATTQCHSMKVTTKNAPVDELNVTNMEFDDYANKTCDYMEDLLSNLLISAALTQAQKKEMETQMAQLRKDAKEMYDLKTTTKTINRYSSHYYYFPVNNLGNSCFLEIDDIKSIECYEEDGYIIRKVTMNEDTYIGDEFPTGNEGFSQRWKTISYGKVFNIPDFDETEGTKETSILNKVTFKNGVIISKVDKLSGIPVSVEYSYSYVADISTIPTVDKDGNEGLQMDSVTQATNTESYVLNPVTKN
ncbi:MAG: hypothetical protein IJN94_02640 [Clostridia bacterium]|nr:hypothetical protein [Clostridia bacterium]